MPGDYQRVARIIGYLEDHQASRPGMAEVAAAAGLSPGHLHRLFQRWAGVTPKAYLQCLTLQRAMAALAGGADVEAATWDAGLSGTGRLHDLCVRLEALTPGEMRRAAEGIEIGAGLAESPFGPCLLAWTGRGIAHLAFLDPSDEVTARMATLRARWPRARLRPDDARAAALAERIFRRPGEIGAPSSNAAELRLWVAGSAFQLRVWRALLEVPEGRLVAYGDLARRVGRPGAARAVGGAIGANPLAYLIPCHRVIRASGRIGGYRWGPIRKRALIARELAGRGLDKAGP